MLPGRAIATSLPSLFAALAITMLAGGCGQDPAPPSAPLSPTPPPPYDLANGARDPADTVNLIAAQYWEAMNAYDTGRVLAFLEPVYREAEREQIGRDISRMRLFRVRLGVSNESPPALLSSGEWELWLRIDTPIGPRRVQQKYAFDGDRWWITYSEQVPAEP